jgi:DNA-binding NarL/FixJ family response regulator
VYDGARRTAVVYDPHPLWLDALERVLERIGIDVAGRATRADDVPALVATLRPNVLIADLGEDTAHLRSARECLPELHTVAMSMSDDERDLDAAFSAGADVFVVKTAHQDDIASAIRQTFEHSVYFAHDRRLERSSLAAEEDGVPQLTRRERQILGLAAEGHSNAQLARMLWVDEQTIKFHLSNVYRKLKVANRTEASRWAQTHGLLPLGRSNGGNGAAEPAPSDD